MGKAEAQVIERLEFNCKMEKFLKPIEIKIFYDKNLKEITGKNSEISMVSEGLSFANFLYFIFSSYPEIQRKFPPGKLGFLLNGKKPLDNDILKHGDELRLIGIESKEK